MNLESMDTMLDIETLGQEPGCVVVSIGAVHFDRHGIHDEMLVKIDIEDAADHGLHIDANTLQWWLDQSQAARRQLHGTTPLIEALHQYAEFHTGNVWANAPTFDCRILGAAYDAIGIKQPWHYSEERCYRTLSNLVDVEFKPSGTNHDALDDAVNQAEYAIKALEKIND